MFAGLVKERPGYAESAKTGHSWVRRDRRSWLTLAWPKPWRSDHAWVVGEGGRGASLASPLTPLKHCNDFYAGSGAPQPRAPIAAGG